MTSRSSHSRISYACLVALPLLAACGPTPQRPLRIGLNPWPGYEFLYLAQEKGYFNDEGVSVKLVEYGSLGDVRRGYELGQVEGICSTLVEVLHAQTQSSRRPRIVIASDFSSGADVVIGGPAIASATDLAGRRVGVEKFSLGYLVLARALELSGMAMADVITAPMDVSEMDDALQAGSVDAVVAYPPGSLHILASGSGRVVFDSSRIPGEILDVISFDASVLEERGEDVARVVHAFDRALAFAHANPDEAHALMAGREAVSVDAFRQALAGITILTPDVRASLMRDQLPAVVARTNQVLRQAGLLDGPDRSAELVVPADAHHAEDRRLGAVGPVALP